MLQDHLNNGQYQNNQRAGVPGTAYGVTRLTALHSAWLRHDGAGVRLTRYIVGTYRRDIDRSSIDRARVRARNGVDRGRDWR